MNCFIETLSYTRTLLPEKGTCRVAEPSMLPPGCADPDFSGQQTNITPTKYVMWSLSREQKLLDRIVAVVTDNCVDEKLSGLGGRSTLAYYLDEMTRYVERLCAELPPLGEQIRQRWGSAENYLNSICMPVRISKKVDSKSWFEVVNKIIEGVSDEEHIDLYYDFTGGFRIASLVSLLLLKVVEVRNSTVKQVVYVERSGDEKIINDCTDTYSVLSDLEQLAIANASPEDRAAKMTDALKKLGFATDEDQIGLRVLDDIRKKERKNLMMSNGAEYRRSAEDFGKGFAASNSIVSNVGKQEIERLRTSSTRSAFRKLIDEQKKPEDLIKKFHEELIKVLLDEKILVYNGKKVPGQKKLHDYVSDLVKANDSYYSRCYSHFNKKTGKKETVECGVVTEVQKWLEDLRDFAWYTPERTMASRLNTNRQEYIQSLESMWWIKGFTATMTRRFDDYLKSMKAVPQPSQGSGFGAERIAWQRVYYNYGFPFDCLSNNGQEEYSEVRDYYLAEALALMDRLGNLQKEEPAAYRRELERLRTDRKRLEEYLPYMTETELPGIRLSRERFSSSDMADQFLRTISRQLQEVRPYRNAVAHELKNEYGTPEALLAEANRIRGWLEEYDQLFHGE